MRWRSSAGSPEWLGTWIAKHGRKEQQYAYLFRPNIEVEVDITDRIGSRPPDIKRPFWASKSAVILNTLLDSDDEMYLAWAHGIGFDSETPAESKPAAVIKLAPMRQGA